MNESVNEKDSILVVEGVSHVFGGVKAVDNCSFSVRRGSITGLIGPNGAGKSTMIEIISGGLKLRQGHVVYDGMEIGHNPPHVLAARGLYRTYQLSREFASLTVLENLVVVDPNTDESVIGALLMRGRMLRLQQQAVDHAERILERFGIYHMRYELAQTLSGGQKRLLELARAMMTNPKLLLLDEPMAGINPALMESVEHHLSDIRDHFGTTILVVEHNLGVVDRLCEEVIVMAEGTTLATGTMADHRANLNVIRAYLGSAA